MTRALFNHVKQPLRDIELRRNNLTEIGARAFEGLTALKTLELRYNSIENIADGAFADLSSCTYLDLDENKLAEVRAGMFQGLSALTELDIGSNGLSTIGAGAFSPLKSLIRLNFAQNRYHFSKFLGGYMSFIWATGTPVLDFWQCLLWVSKPEWVLSYLLFCGGEGNVHSLRFTSGATHTDLLAASSTVGHFPTCISRGWTSGGRQYRSKRFQKWTWLKSRSA